MTQNRILALANDLATLSAVRKSYRGQQFSTKVAAGFRKAELEAALARVLTKKRAGLITFQDLKDTANAAGEGLTNFLDAPTAQQLAEADLKGTMLAVADAGGDPTSLSLVPDPTKYSWQSRMSRLFENPENRTRGLLAAGGAGGGFLLSRMLSNREDRRRRDQAARQLEAMGLKTAGLEEIKQFFANLPEKAKEVYADYKVGDTVNSAMSTVSDKASQYKEMIQAGLADPSKRPYVAAALGAAVGGGAAGVAQLFNGRKKKRMLNSILSGSVGGALLGGGYGALTSGGASSSPSRNVVANADAIMSLPSEEQEKLIGELDSTIDSQTPSLLSKGLAEGGKTVSQNPFLFGTAAALGVGNAVGTVNDMRAQSRAVDAAVKNVAALEAVPEKPLPMFERFGGAFMDRDSIEQAKLHASENKRAIDSVMRDNEVRANRIRDAKADLEAIRNRPLHSFGKPNDTRVRKFMRRTVFPTAGVGAIGAIGLGANYIWPGVKEMIQSAGDRGGYSPSVSF